MCLLACGPAHEDYRLARRALGGRDAELVDEGLDVGERTDVALIDDPQAEHVRLIDGEARRALHGDDVGHVSELAVAVARSEHHKAADPWCPAFGSPGEACGVRPFPRVTTPVDVAQRRHVPGALSPRIVVETRT